MCPLYGDSHSVRGGSLLLSSLDSHQLCEDLSFVCKVTLRYLGLRRHHLNFKGHDVTPHTLQRLRGRNRLECSKDGMTAFMVARGESRGKESRLPGQE